MAPVVWWLISSFRYDLLPLIIVYCTPRRGILRSRSVYCRRKVRNLTRCRRRLSCNYIIAVAPFTLTSCITFANTRRRAGSSSVGLIVCCCPRTSCRIALWDAQPSLRRKQTRRPDASFTLCSIFWRIERGRKHCSRCIKQNDAWLLEYGGE